MSQTIVAPRYRPAAEYRPPTPAPFELGADTLAIEELISAPATLKIVETHASWALRMAQSESFGPFRSLFTLRDAAVFLPIDVSGSIAAVDAALRAVPRSQWPASVR